MNQYQQISRFMVTLITENRLRQGEAVEFLIRSRGLSHDSPGHIRSFIYRIYRKAAELQYLDAMLDTLSGEERAANLRRQKEVRLWLCDLYNQLDDKFIEDLKTRH